MIFPRLQGKTRTRVQLMAVVATMASLSFAAVPFYDWFCRVTGYGGTPQRAEAAPDTILDQTVKIRFDATVEQGMPWTFKPVVRSIEKMAADKNDIQEIKVTFDYMENIIQKVIQQIEEELTGEAVQPSYRLSQPVFVHLKGILQTQIQAVGNQGMPDGNLEQSGYLFPEKSQII